MFQCKSHPTLSSFIKKQKQKTTATAFSMYLDFIPIDENTGQFSSVNDKCEIFSSRILHIAIHE